MSGGTRCQSSTGTKVPGPPPSLDEAGVPGLAVPGAPACVCSVRPEGAVPALHTACSVLGPGRGNGWGAALLGARSREAGVGSGPRPWAVHWDNDLLRLLFLSPMWQAILDKWDWLKKKQGEELMGRGSCSVSGIFIVCRMMGSLGRGLVSPLPAEVGSQLRPGFSQGYCSQQIFCSSNRTSFFSFPFWCW